MGGLFSGSKKTTQTTDSTTKPLDFQQTQLDNLFKGAQSNYAAQSGTPWYQGDLYAGMTDQAKANLGAFGSFVGGQGQQNVNGVTGAGQALVGQAGSAIDAYGRAAQGYGTDPTQGNIAAAGAYASNPYLDGQIDAASRDVSRNLYENDLTGIDRSAVGSGNMNSSRAGVAEGIARRGAADRIADISSNMRGQAYQSGLGLAENARTANLQGLMGAGSGFAGLTGQGIGALGQGNQMALGNLDARASADKAGQADSQGELDAAFKAWQGGDTRQSDLLNRYAQIVAANNWGGTTTGTGTTTAKNSGNILGQLTSAASSIGSLVSASDPRLKKNVRKVGQLEDGLGVYVYEYRQDMGLELAIGPQFGVMADEVARLRPDALGPELPGGFMTVDYALL